MAAILSGSTMWSLILQGDAMTKFILLFLFSMSIVSWSIALYKLILFRIKIAQLQQVVASLRDVEEFKSLFIVMKNHMKTMPGYFLSENTYANSLLSASSVNALAYTSIALPLCPGLSL